MVRTLVVLMDLSIADLVTAFVMFGRCGARHRCLFVAVAARRFFLGCCLIARKINTDAGSRARSGRTLFRWSGRGRPAAARSGAQGLRTCP